MPGCNIVTIWFLYRVTMRQFTPLVAILLLLQAGCSTFKKDEKVLITVFSQGSDMDSPKSIFRRNVEGREVILKVIPEFTHRSIIAFHPFPAEDGTYGVSLKLDFKGANALEIVTRTRQGEMLVSMVNGAIVDYVTIDGIVNNGIFTIWRGLPEELIKVMEEEYPRISALKKSTKDTPYEQLDMLPSTSKEKQEVHDRVKDDAKKDEKDAKRRARGEFDPEPPIPGGVVPLSEALDPKP